VSPTGSESAGDLGGRTALITGASQGFGLEIARSYLRAGVRGICVCGRDRATLEGAASELRELASSDQEVFAELADVSREDEVERLVDATLDRLGGLTILVNNAGVYGPKGPVAHTDWTEWARAIEINLYGSVLPARAVVAHFADRGYGKIVQLSGGGATAPLAGLSAQAGKGSRRTAARELDYLAGLSAYAASKAAIVRFAETLAVELRDHHVDVNAIAPGALNTRMLDEVLAAGPEAVGQAFYDRAIEQQRSGGVPLAQGAELAVFLASAASDGITGKLLSAVWDPWSELPAHLSELDSDVYTLRRVVPADRGMDWGG
jgi:NAD(P)-dependent dehydrogenase (short-subunit alcohol dehydrogenase family)